MSLPIVCFQAKLYPQSNALPHQQHATSFPPGIGPAHHLLLDRLDHALILLNAGRRAAAGMELAYFAYQARNRPGYAMERDVVHQVRKDLVHGRDAEAVLLLAELARVNNARRAL